MYIYPRIRDLREDHDLSQQEIAEILNTRQTQYSRWERGAYEIPCHVVVELAKLFHTTTDELLKGGHPTNET